MISLNNKFILEPYTGTRKIESEITSGFAKIKQKSNLIGLKMLADAVVVENGTRTVIPTGYTAYVSEEFLFNNKTHIHQYECDGIDGKFIVIDSIHILFVKEVLS